MNFIQKTNTAVRNLGYFAGVVQDRLSNIIIFQSGDGKIGFETIPFLYTLYRPRDSKDIYRGMPMLIISVLSGLYISVALLILCIGPIKSWFYFELAFYLQFLVVGLISADEFKRDRFVIVDRVSTEDQQKNTDFDERLESLRSYIKETCEGEIIKEFTGSESAATMNREQLDEILLMAKSDEFDVLAVRHLDRLTRAEPWETVSYLLDVRRTGITLYEHPRQFYSWDDPQDFRLLTQKILFSHKWYLRTQEGRQRGVHRELRNGRLPYPAPFGYELDDDRNIQLDHSKGPILYRIFEIYLQEEDTSDIPEIINTRFGEQLEKDLTENRIKTVLNSRLCIGELEYEGSVWHEIPRLAAVTEKQFEKVQEMLESDSSDQPNKIPEQIVEATTKLGIEYIQSILEQISFRRCKECNGELECYSETDVFGIPVEKVECEDCGYDGPLISAKDFRQIHQTAPLSCPFCYRTEEFIIEESEYASELYRYACKNCSIEFHTEVGPNKYLRYQNHPNIGIEIDDENNYEDNDEEDAKTDKDEK
jgi:site-specific DNA recombinase